MAPPPAAPGGPPPLLAGQDERAALKDRARELPALDLTPAQLAQLELLLSGALFPLTGFTGSKDHRAIAQDMRLADGRFWPLPMPLEAPPAVQQAAGQAGGLALNDLEGATLAVLGLSGPDLAGPVQGLELPSHHDFSRLRLAPAAAREALASLGRPRVICHQTHSILRPAELSSLQAACQAQQASLLLQVLVPPSSPEDLDHFARVRAIERILPRIAPIPCVLGLIPWPFPRPSDPDQALRQTLLRAILAQNHGASHLWLGPGEPADWPPAALQALTIRPLPLALEDPAGGAALDIEACLEKSVPVPVEACFPEALEELARVHPSRLRKGFCVFFTGLPCSGKSTLANKLRARLMERGGRPVTLLDGDVVRRYLSSELGFSQKDRDTNIRRIGFVASEISKNGGIALCAPIAPYDSVRREVRSLVERRGGFVLVHVATPLAECERRDRKGMYAKARAGLIKEYTGISDPYQIPTDAELALDTSGIEPEQSVALVLAYLEREGWLPAKA